MNDIIIIDNLLDPLACDLLVRNLKQVGWRDPQGGGKDREDYVKAVKQHKELRPNHHKDVDHASKMLQTQIKKSKLFLNIVIPKRIRYFQFNHYTEGGNYNWHSDAADMGGMLTDYTVVIGLNSPDDYEGGTHLYEDGGEIQKFRVNKGQAVMYPSGVLHKVEPVTKGERIVAISWVESYCNPFHRSLLVECTQVIEEIKKECKQFSPASNRATSLYNNLRRALCR